VLVQPARPRADLVVPLLDDPAKNSIVQPQRASTFSYTSNRGTTMSLFSPFGDGKLNAPVVALLVVAGAVTLSVLFKTNSVVPPPNSSAADPGSGYSNPGQRTAARLSGVLNGDPGAKTALWKEGPVGTGIMGLRLPMLVQSDEIPYPTQPIATHYVHAADGISNMDNRIMY